MFAKYGYEGVEKSIFYIHLISRHFELHIFEKRYSLFTFTFEISLIKFFDCSTLQFVSFSFEELIFRYIYYTPFQNNK